MTEKIITLDNIDPVDIFGVNDVKLKIIRNFFPKLKIIGRGDQLKIIGEESEINYFESRFTMLVNYLNKHNVLPETAIDALLGNKSKEDKSSDNAIVYGNNGKPITSRNQGQRKMADAIQSHDLLFAIGPAGSGKTYLAVALAVRALRDKQVKRIIMSRPAVEAGENLGFLPGDLKEKIDPYMQALYDALHDMLPFKKLAEYMEKGIIQIAPLAYMRGRTLSNAFVVLDEAQNTTTSQLRMFLTRMGENTKFVVTGDVTQIDLPRKQASGLVQAERILKNIDGIAFVKFSKDDIVRHKLVKAIVHAYDKEDEQSQDGKYKRDDRS